MSSIRMRELMQLLESETPTKKDASAVSTEKNDSEDLLASSGIKSNDPAFDLLVAYLNNSPEQKWSQRGFLEWVNSKPKEHLSAIKIFLDKFEDRKQAAIHLKRVIGKVISSKEDTSNTKTTVSSKEDDTSDSNTTKGQIKSVSDKGVYSGSEESKTATKKQKPDFSQFLNNGNYVFG